MINNFASNDSTEDRDNSHFMHIRILFILLFCTLLFNCSIREKPEFIGIENIKVINASAQSVALSADAFFLNNNDVGGVLKTDGLKVYINDTEVATVVTDKFEVPSRKKFKIPINVVVATDRILNNNSLGGLLGSLISQRFKVQYKGDIKYKVFGYSSIYSIDQTQELKIKL